MFSDLAIKAASETANLGITEHLTNLSYITHNYSPTAGEKYSAVAVPVISLSAGEFNELSNNFCTAQGVDATVVTLDKRFISQVGLTDVQAGETDINILRDGTKAITNALTKKIQQYVFSTITETTAPLSASFSGASKSAYAELYKVASDNGLDPYRCSIVFTPEYFSKLLATMDANIYGGADAVRGGVIPGMYGFKSVAMSPYLPNGVKGVIIDESSFAIVSRLDKPAVDGYPLTYIAENDDGFAIQFRMMENLCEGRMTLAASVLVGSKILNTNGVIRLV